MARFISLLLGSLFLGSCMGHLGRELRSDRSWDELNAVKNLREDLKGGPTRSTGTKTYVTARYQITVVSSTPLRHPRNAVRCRANVQNKESATPIPGVVVWFTQRPEHPGKIFDPLVMYE